MTFGEVAADTCVKSRLIKEQVKDLCDQFISEAWVLSLLSFTAKKT